MENEDFVEESDDFSDMAEFDRQIDDLGLDD